MRNGGIVIATGADCLFLVLRDKLRELDIHPVLAARNDHALMEKIKNTYPRFVFLENCFHEQATEEYVVRLLRCYRDLRIVVWSAIAVKPVIAARYVLAGAESFFTLRDTDENITGILDRVNSGRRYCPAEVEAVINGGYYLPAIGRGLTPREREVIKLCVNKQSNREIAAALGVKPTTVKAHKMRIYRKCGGNTPVDILRYGLRQGVIRPEDLNN